MKQQRQHLRSSSVSVSLLLALIGLAGCASNPAAKPPATQTPGTPPPTTATSTAVRTPPASIVRDGVTLGFVGNEVWAAPVLDEVDPRAVWVYAGVDGGPSCTVVPVAHVVTQSARGVRVLVATYAAPPPSLPSGTQFACAAVAHGAVGLKVELTQPLGTRPLQDADDRNAARAVLDPKTVPAPTPVPTGYSARSGPQWTNEFPGTAARYYTGPGGNSLTVTVGPAGLNRHVAIVRGRSTVLGHPATVSSSKGFEQDILISWAVDATHVVQLYQTSIYLAKYPPFTAEQLLKIANSLRY